MGVSVAIGSIGSLGSRYGSARRYNIAMTSPDLTFILGGARSGKSAYAERLAVDSGLPVTYVATARTDDTEGDTEFAARVEQHRERRPAHWALVEAPLDLAGVLRELDHEGHVVLIDCLTLWLANLLFPADGSTPDGPPLQAFSDFDAALSNVRGKVIVVSNEIGLGVVPMGSVTRLYVDELGRLNQRVATASTHVTMMVAGLPLVLKG
jgi:adenosylcobinamide kinase/adenosylcobinamide-phosphate guanylyltransferase